MSFDAALDEALDGVGGPGTVEVESEGTRARIDVAQAGPVGARVREVHVETARPRPVETSAAVLPDRLRSLGERVRATEVDPRLGGATLRTRPEDMRQREFFEVEVRGERDRTVRRYRIGDDGREQVDWPMTREGLGRLLDELT